VPVAHASAAAGGAAAGNPRIEPSRTQTAAPEPTTTAPRSLPARFHTAPMLDLGGSGAAVIVLP
jgi:hypothetical protein